MYTLAHHSKFSYDLAIKKGREVLVAMLVILPSTHGILLSSIANKTHLLDILYLHQIFETDRKYVYIVLFET